MDKIVIIGGENLKGEVKISGAKNAALPIMSATLLTKEECIIDNVPNLRDITTMSRILRTLGSRVNFNEEAQRLIIANRNITGYEAPYEMVRTMRASVCVLGPLIGRFGKAKVSMPGGCVIGQRPIDLHLHGLKCLGAEIKMEHGYIIARAAKLKGKEIYLGGAFGSSVLATANVMMAAVLAKGETIIENAACEPEVCDLANFLNSMGAEIRGIGSHALYIKGVRKLHGARYKIIPDRIEAGTFIVACAITKGMVRIRSARPEHLMVVINKVRQAGSKIDIKAGDIFVKGGRRVLPVDITTLPYPGFPTDLQAQMMSLLTLTRGISVITEKIYPDRFMHVAELNRMGSDIHVEKGCAIVRGVRHLSGAPLMASDLRASAALILAGLVALGRTEVRRVYHLDRGYDRLEEKLSSLGANIKREKE
jgi:UDP-N-acetylglucosamine 1-carboxyvinyltransferase